MQKIIIVCFLGLLINQVYCDQCSCSTMDNCVETERGKRTTCQNQCATSLTTGGTKALQCILDKSAADLKAKSDIKTCMETALGRPCSSTRVRRNAPFQGGPPGGMGGHHGFGGFGKMDFSGVAQTEMKAFKKCVFDCLSPNNPNPMPLMGGKPGGPGHHGPFGGGFDKYYGMCPRINNCNLTPLNFQQNPTAARACIPTTPPTTDTTFCTCMQGVYSTTNVACKSA